MGEERGGRGAPGDVWRKKHAQRGGGVKREGGAGERGCVGDGGGTQGTRGHQERRASQRRNWASERGSGPRGDRVSPQGRERGFQQERTPRGGGVSPLRVGDGRGRGDMLGCESLWVRRGTPGGRRRGCWGRGPPPFEHPFSTPQHPRGRQVTRDEASGPGSLRV